MNTLGGREISESTSFTLSAAPKKNGPLISKISTPGGISRPCKMRFRLFNVISPVSWSSPSRNLSVTPSTFVRSAIRFMKSRAEATMPTWTATVKSTNTVRMKVISRTITSLRGARSNPANERHSLM